MNDKNLIDTPLKEEISDDEFLHDIKTLHMHNYENSEYYRNWIGFFFDISSINKLKKVLKTNDLAKFPYLPSSAFKYNKLISTSSEEVIKIMQSSGTSSGIPSKIFLDRKTSGLMTERLRIDTNKVIGSYRRPLFIVDDKNIFSNRKSFIARGAAIAGLIRYGSSIDFLLDGDSINEKALFNLKKNSSQEILIIGTTVNIWTKFIPLFSRLNINLENASIVHGGGWKKLEKRRIDNVCFKDSIYQCCKINKVINFFGMVEQLGSISYECKAGNFHIPEASRFIVRSENDGSILSDGEIGLLQVNSILPYSYPGASILTDDLIMIDSSSICRCGNRKPIFKYIGRVKMSEIRGCGSS